jgi:hypothetical protein
MLPGFRFLFAAIVLSVSIAVFGFGAAALFRSAHEEFANDTAWRPAPETRFAEAEPAPQPAAPPVLAMLSVDDPAKATTAETAKAEPLPPSPAPTSATVLVPVPAEAEKTAALQPTVPVPSPPVQPEAPIVASPGAEPANPTSAAAAPASPAPAIAAASEMAPATVEAPAIQNETQTATAEPPAAPLSDDPSAWPPETFDPAPNQSSAADTHAISSRIATLGGPPVIIEQPGAKTARARAEARTDVKPDAKDDNAAAKRLRAKRLAAAHRRRIAAARARATQQASQMEQPLPFGPATAQIQPAR